jgi:hypothetical protein
MLATRLLDDLIEARFGALTPSNPGQARRTITRIAAFLNGSFSSQWQRTLGPIVDA